MSEDILGVLYGMLPASSGYFSTIVDVKSRMRRYTDKLELMPGLDLKMMLLCGQPSRDQDAPPNPSAEQDLLPFTLTNLTTYCNLKH